MDDILELSAVLQEQDVEMDSPDSLLEITVADKMSNLDEEQQGTPLTDVSDTDFSNGKKFKLPCSDRQLEKMMREVGIDGIATTEASCQVKITNAVCPALCGMVVDSPNFRELNFLAQQLKKMPAEELRIFNKIVAYERQLNPDITPAEVINISYNLDNYRVYDVSGAKTVEERFQKLGENESIYQSADDIDRLSGFINRIKNSFGFK